LAICEIFRSSKGGMVGWWPNVNTPMETTHQSVGHQRVHTSTQHETTILSPDDFIRSDKQFHEASVAPPSVCK